MGVVVTLWSLTLTQGKPLHINLNPSLLVPVFLVLVVGFDTVWLLNFSSALFFVFLMCVVARFTVVSLAYLFVAS